MKNKVNIAAFFLQSICPFTKKKTPIQAPAWVGIYYSGTSKLDCIKVWLLPYYFSFALEPLLPKKLHAKSQDKLDRDEPEKEQKKEKKKEKRNSKHQEMFDKDLKAAEINQPAEAVILSETVVRLFLLSVFEDFQNNSPFSINIWGFKESKNSLIWDFWRHWTPSGRNDLLPSWSNA